MLTLAAHAFVWVYQYLGILTGRSWERAIFDYLPPWAETLRAYTGDFLGNWFF